MRSTTIKHVERACCLALCALLLFSSGARGQTLGGFMSHVNIGVSGSQVLVFKDEPELVPQMIGPEIFESPYSVLNGKGYNAQFGWVALFPFDLHGDRIWIKSLEQSPGLQTFQGGVASDSNGGTPDAGGHTMAPILGTFGSEDFWEWSGAMAHNWYAATEPGEYFVTYEVYVGDTSGVPNTAYTPAEVTFEFINSVTALIGDLNTDGFVGVDDLNMVLTHWNQDVMPADPLAGDPNGDGFVGVDDLNIVLAHWNNGTPPNANAVPEPASALLACVGGWFVLQRRNRFD